MKIKPIAFICLSIGGLFWQPLFAQEHIIKALFEENRERKYALYASTLRMVNLSKNPDYNEMVSGVDKILIYQLDSATVASRAYRQLDTRYLEEGFEPYASAYGGKMNVSILGNEDGRRNVFSGYLVSEDYAVAFYMKGNVAWQKIPALIESLRDDELLNFFDLTDNRREKRVRSKRPE